VRKRGASKDLSKWLVCLGPLLKFRHFLWPVTFVEYYWIDDVDNLVYAFKTSRPIPAVDYMTGDRTGSFFYTYALFVQQEREV
jgi:hypothetical protein